MHIKILNKKRNVCSIYDDDDDEDVSFKFQAKKFSKNRFYFILYAQRTQCNKYFSILFLSFKACKIKFFSRTFNSRYLKQKS